MASTVFAAKSRHARLAVAKGQFPKLAPKVGKATAWEPPKGLGSKQRFTYDPADASNEHKHRSTGFIERGFDPIFGRFGKR